MAKPIIVISCRNNGWILDCIASDLKKYLSGRILYLPISKRQIILRFKAFILLRKNNLIFMHQNLFIEALESSPRIKRAKSVVFFTHQMSVNETALSKLVHLRNAKKIIVMSRTIKFFLISVLGEDFSEKIVVRVGGADLSFFSNKQLNREQNTVILVIYFALRKRPDLILQTVRANPDFTFILHGRNWKDWIFFNDLSKLPNFEYHEFNFVAANSLFNRAYTFLSLSDVEGGPLPALEGLSAGLRVIITDTGFARDLKEISSSVEVIPINPTADQIRSALEKSLTNPPPHSHNIKDLFSYDKFLSEFYIK